MTVSTPKTPSGAPYLDPFYYVQDPGLPELLSKYGVRLILSGHRHAQEIRRHSGDGSCGPLFEIISSPLSSWPFAFGLLCADEGALSYRTEPLDFASYGAPYGTSGIPEEYGENARSAAYAPLFEELFSKAPLSRNDRAGAEALLFRFLEYKACGTLAAHRAEIAADPYCRKLLSALEGTNYGPWIRYEMETAALPGNALFIPAGGKSP